MKKLSIIAISCFALIASGFIVSNIWNVKNEEATISFELPNNGTKGTIGGLKATLDFNAKDPANSKIIASVDVKTLNTGDAKKDTHLMSADFFNADKYPTMSFTSSSIKTSSEGFIAIGELHIKDSTKTIEIPFTFAEEKGAGTFKGTTTILGGDYGIMKKSATEKDKVAITISVPVAK
jgi:polyisoprenoid-binding protein YceI